MMHPEWNEVAGQDRVKEILDQIILSSKIPHAFLFQGPEGSGKFTTALTFAQILNKYSSLHPEKTANFIQNLAEPYIKYIFPLPRGKNETEKNGPFEKLSNDELNTLKEEICSKVNNPYYKIKIPGTANIKISSIRDINRFLSMAYEDIKYRFILVSDSHLMNEESQNALLKNLEEPPEGVVFILMTPFPAMLRATIRSRCWAINFSPLNNSETEKILSEFFKVEKGKAGEVSLFSGGSVTSALNLLDNDFDFLMEKTIVILRYSFGGRIHSALNEINYFITEDNPDELRLIIQLIIIWLNELQKNRNNIDGFYFKKFSETFVKFNIKFPSVNLNNIASRLDYLSSLIKNNVNPNLISLNIVFELASFSGRMKPER